MQCSTFERKRITVDQWFGSCSSSSVTVSVIYLERAAQAGNKLAGIWRSVISDLCSNTKTSFKWWSRQKKKKNSCCLISTYSALQTAGTSEWSWYCSFQVQTPSVQKHLLLQTRQQDWNLSEGQTRDYKIKDSEFALLNLSTFLTIEDKIQKHKPGCMKLLEVW